MQPPLPSRRPRIVRLLAVIAAVLGGAGLLLVLDPGERAEAREPRVARSVCEAQQLKADRLVDPELEVEIPPEYDKPFPSLSACLSHELAWDDAAPGPRQPIPFSHAHHAGMYQIDCLYCHSGTDRSRAAGVPSVELCMGCHAQFPAEYDELEGIRILKQHWERRETIPWQQVYRLPEHVKFRHNRHLSDTAKSLGVQCQTCHGAVQEQHKLALSTDLIWWKASVTPTQPLLMGWCIDCHRKNAVSQDCLTCHY